MTVTDKDIRKYTERCQVNQGPPVMTGVRVGGGFGGQEEPQTGPAGSSCWLSLATTMTDTVCPQRLCH